jgi:hypothetical protein
LWSYHWLLRNICSIEINAYSNVSEFFGFYNHNM